MMIRFELKKDKKIPLDIDIGWYTNSSQVRPLWLILFYDIRNVWEKQT